jgi:uncharacterized membrane protein YccF (DUF307 family)
VRLILNILRLVLCGFWMAIAYLLAALVMFILIITIPFALQAVKLATFALWPSAGRSSSDPRPGRHRSSATSSGWSSPAGGSRSAT